MLAHIMENASQPQTISDVSRKVLVVCSNKKGAVCKQMSDNYTRRCLPGSSCAKAFFFFPFVCAEIDKTEVQAVLRK